MHTLTEEQRTDLYNAIICVMNDYDISHKNTTLSVINNDITSKAIRMFFVSKKVEGCSDNTLKYYKHVINYFFSRVVKRLEEIAADDVRYYIAVRAMHDEISKVSQNNELRVLKSFFSWCVAENYLDKNPTANVKPIKQDKIIKRPFSETEMELLRKKTQNARDLAIIDVLFSTGVRVSELCQMNISDIKNDEITVIGKGAKERVVYFNAKSKLSVLEYLNTRTDDNNALFVSCHKPYSRLTKGAIERIVRNIGEMAGIKETHPHRFRRTAATLALNRGMPIDQVSAMLGHNRIETTTIYARSEQENVKASHKKYVV